MFQIAILRQQSKGIGIEMNTAVILVVSKQPLKCMEHCGPPNMKVTMGIGSSLFPDHNDVELTGQTRQGVGKASYIVFELTNDARTRAK